MHQGPLLHTPMSSSSYVVIDDRGHALDERDAIEDAVRLSRRMPGAFAVVGAPSGVVIARVAKPGEAASSETAARFAAKKWARGAARGSAA